MVGFIRRGCNQEDLVVHILWLSFILICCWFTENLEGRSRYRLLYEVMPEISARWLDESEDQAYHLKSFYLREYPLFTIFDREYIYRHMLPEKSISYRNEPDKSVDSTKLTSIIEKTVSEIYKYNRKPPSLDEHFIILKKYFSN